MRRIHNILLINNINNLDLGCNIRICWGIWLILILLRSSLDGIGDHVANGGRSKKTGRDVEGDLVVAGVSISISVQLLRTGGIDDKSSKGRSQEG